MAISERTAHYQSLLLLTRITYICEPSSKVGLEHTVTSGLRPMSTGRSMPYSLAYHGNDGKQKAHSALSILASFLIFLRAASFYYWLLTLPPSAPRARKDKRILAPAWWRHQKRLVGPANSARVAVQRERRDKRVSVQRKMILPNA